MNPEYNPNHIEKAIQDEWLKENKFKATPDNREKFYCLSMFPIPIWQVAYGSCSKLYDR